MGKLNFDGYQWIGTTENDHEYCLIRISDATLEKYLKQYLERTGVPTLTYLELLAYVDKVMEQRHQAAQQLQNLDFWLNCHDPDVRVLRYTAPRRPKC